jgi:hypothetical protein
VDQVQIFGEGIAASCCQHLFAQAGIPSFHTAGPRPRVPAIMLGQTAQKLLSDVCRHQGLFEAATPVRTRTIAWGADGKVKQVPHSGVVVSEDILLGRMHGEWPLHNGKPGGSAPRWTVFASRTQPQFREPNHFGSRLAKASTVTFAAGVPPDSCYLESLNTGWLFALPAAEGRGWLLSVGGPVDELLEQSRLMCSLLFEVRPAGGEFPCHPRIADPISGGDWLLCGTAATGFDPLCGDGAGFAAREAILAAAVIRAAIRGGDATALSQYYQSGILAGFRKHLAACLSFYREGNSGPWWEQQCDELQRGIVWCDRKLRDIARAPLCLRGFELVPVA